MNIPDLLQQLGTSTQGLVTTARLTAAGASRADIARAAARGEVVRIRRGVYALSALPALPRHLVTDTGVAPAYVALVRSILLSIGVGAAACCRTAAALRGWALLVEPGQVEIAVPHGSDAKTKRKGIRTTQRRSAARTRARVLPGTDRLRLTSAVQTALDCATSLPLLEAVVACDSALRSGQVQLDELRRAAARLPGVRGAERVRRVLSMCDPLSGSVLESVLRVRLLQAGIDGFTTQAVLVRSPGVRVDFCFEAARLVVEVDGARWHTNPGRDQSRDNLLAMLGWRVLRYTWADVVHSPEAVLADVRTALAATSTVQLPVPWAAVAA